MTARAADHDTYTTKQVAVMIGASSAAVKNWDRRGEFPHTRRYSAGLAGGPQYRQFFPEDIAAFCRRHGRPVPAAIEQRVLLVGVEPGLAAGLIAQLNVAVEVAGTAFAAGQLAARSAFAAAVVDAATLGRERADEVVAGLAAAGCRVALLLPDDAQLVVDLRCAAVLKQSAGPEAVVRAIGGGESQP